jgi:hypothetical protein
MPPFTVILTFGSCRGDNHGTRNNGPLTGRRRLLTRQNDPGPIRRAGVVSLAVHAAGTRVSLACQSSGHVAGDGNRPCLRLSLQADIGQPNHPFG